MRQLTEKQAARQRKALEQMRQRALAKDAGITTGTVDKLLARLRSCHGQPRFDIAPQLQRTT